MADVSRLPGPNADFWDWQMHAACRGVDSEMFFHPEGERGGAKEAREREAKALCASCPVLMQCRAHALQGARAVRRVGRADRVRARRDLPAAGPLPGERATA